MVGRTIMRGYFSVSLLKRILVALVLGVITGIILGFFPDSVSSYVAHTQFFGDLFIRLLKMIVIPVVFFSIVCGVASLEIEKLGRVGIKTLLFYMFTSIVAILVGLFFANIIRPGFGFVVEGSASAKAHLSAAPELRDILLKIVPTNPLKALVNGDMLSIIFFAMMLGFALSYIRNSQEALIKKSGDTVYYFFNGIAEAMYKIVGGIMHYAPIGVFVLISIVFAQQGPQALGPLLLVTLTVYLAFFTQVIVVYGTILSSFKVKPIQFFKDINEIMVTAFVTRSSSGTLPITLRVAEEKLNIPRSISSFTLPLGATINMDGTAIYMGVCSMFIGYAIGQPLTIAQQFSVVLTATFAAIGTAGVPGSGAIMLVMILDSIGLKLTAGSAVAATYAMILGIDALLDMGRTWINVTGDVVNTLIVAKQEERHNNVVN